MATRSTISIILTGLLAALVLAACGDDGNGGSGSANGSNAGNPGADLPQGREPVDLNPADFTVNIDNPYWPMAPGSRWVYTETDAEGIVQRVVVTVTEKTRQIANGVEARVVHDVVSEDGEPVEITDDWYAQDSDGNIWYLGEDTAEYENGKVSSREGSFEAGVDGAQPGIALPANPEVGMTYRQEYYKGEAEDEARVLSIDIKAEAPFGYFPETLMTNDLNPLDPKVSELKFYARGVGLLLTLDTAGGSGREELISYKRGG